MRGDLTIYLISSLLYTSINLEVLAVNFVLYRGKRIIWERGWRKDKMLSRQQLGIHAAIIRTSGGLGFTFYRHTFSVVNIQPSRDRRYETGPKP